MTHIATTILLAGAFGLIVPDIGLGQAIRPPAPVGSIAGISEPTTRQVVQRRDDNNGAILIIGTCAGNIDGFQARSFLRPGMFGQPLGWSPLVNVTINEGHFVGTFRQPAGGFYDLQVRPVFQGQLGQPITVYAVGVGEVFITAGQSNATNWSSPTGFAPDLRVSSFDPGPGLGIDPAFPGAAWQYGIDPQPVIDTSGGGSTWPMMANNLAIVLNVPVGLYCVGYSGTRAQQWLPGEPFTPPNVPTAQIVLFDRLTNAIRYFDSRGGARGVLWIQGESDYFSTIVPQAYLTQLREIINQSRALTGVPIKWMVAQTASPLADNPPRRASMEMAQGSVIDNVLTFPGPNADSIGLAYRLPSIYGPLHFNAAGAMLMGNYWGIYVANVPGFLSQGGLPPR